MILTKRYRIVYKDGFFLSLYLEDQRYRGQLKSKTYVGRGSLSAEFSARTELSLFIDMNGLKIITRGG